jgi:hypothetical protein
MKKRYINIINLAIGVLFLFGCTDLEVKQHNSKFVELTEDGFIGVNVDDELFAAYGKLNDIAGSSYTGVSGLNCQTSDEMIIPTRATDWGNGGIHRVLHTHNWDPSLPDLLDVWNDMNSAIFTCNQILASSPNANQAAQAKTLRAFLMYHVIDLYGQVPFRNVDQGVDEYPSVMSRSKAVDFAIGDLESSLNDLDEGGPDVEDHTVVSKAFANALLARIYLNKAVYTAENPAGPYTFSKDDMDKVIEYCDAVQAAGFTYEENYFNNFSGNGGSEHILTFSRWWDGMWIWPQLHPSQGGWNGASTLGSFYDIFSPEDQRIGYVPDDGLGRGFLIGPQYGKDGEQLKNSSGNPLSFTREVKLSGNTDYYGIRVLKYDPDNGGDFVLMRYADVRLMKAEAILRGGTPPNGETAQSIVDELRDARDADRIDVNLDMMLAERGRELYWEGLRRIDQVRFETFTKTTWEHKEIMDDNKVVFPIPQQAMDSNPNFTQNEGY